MTSMMLALVLCGATAAETPVGFTADGRYWVSRAGEGGGLGGSSEFGEEEGPFWSAKVATVLDLRTGAATKYALEVKGDNKKAQKAGEDKVKSYGTAAAFDAWLKEHPASLSLGRKSPDGKRSAEISQKPGAGSWNKKDEFVFEREADGDGNCRASFALLVGTHASASWQGEGPGAGMLSGNIRVAWSPDGKKVAWLVHRNAGMMRDRAQDLVLFGPTEGPRVEVLLDKALTEKALPKVREAVDVAGFVVVSTGPAKKAREATVIYAAKGFEPQAKELAAKVPGGATVEALSWAAAGDLVVAVGASVLK